jgi:hypothetical protein
MISYIFMQEFASAKSTMYTPGAFRGLAEARYHANTLLSSSVDVIRVSLFECVAVGEKQTTVIWS